MGCTNSHDILGLGIVVAEPSFAPVPGTFAPGTGITLTSDTPGASIRYTIDGSDPSATDGTEYTGTISGLTTLTIRAIAYLAGKDDSPIVEATFLIPKIYVARGDGIVDVIAGATNPTLNRVYVVNDGNDTVSVIDAETDGVLTTVAAGIGANDVGVNANTGQVYVANNGSWDVTVIDGLTNSVVTTIDAGAFNTPNWLAVNSTTNRIYVSNAGFDNVAVIDGATNGILTSVAVGSQPEGVAVSESTNMVYVSNNIDSTVEVVDGATNTSVTAITVGGGLLTLWGVAVNPTISRVYAIDGQSPGAVVVINATNNTEITTVSVGNTPDHVAVDEAANLLYVTNSADGTVSIVDGATNTVTTTVVVGGSPQAVAVLP